MKGQDGWKDTTIKDRKGNSKRRLEGQEVIYWRMERNEGMDRKFERIMAGNMEAQEM